MALCTPASTSVSRAALLAVAGELETRIERAELPPGQPVKGFIILGGNISRAIQGTALANRYRDARLILSGASPQEEDHVRRNLRNPERLIIDRRPTNTFENGWYSKELAEPLGRDNWVLITSALHMPRAIGVFNALDFDVAPWPLDDAPGGRELARLVAHEMLGLAGYWALGRSSAIFPSTDRNRPPPRKAASTG